MAAAVGSPPLPRGPRTHHLVAASPRLVVIHPARLGVWLPSGRVPSGLSSFGLPGGRRRRAPSAASGSAAALARRGRFTSCRSLCSGGDLRVARRAAPQLRGAARATEHARGGRACSLAPPASHPRPGGSCEGVPRWEEMEKSGKSRGDLQGVSLSGVGGGKRSGGKRKKQSPRLIGLFPRGQVSLWGERMHRHCEGERSGERRCIPRARESESPSW